MSKKSATVNYKMTSKVEKKENSMVNLEITVDKGDVRKEFEKALVEINKKAQVPGFRTGKIPAPVLRKKFLPNIKYTVLNEIVPNALQKALEDNSITAYSQPDFDEVEDILEDQDFTFKASVEVAPTITLGNYKGLSAKKNTYSYDKDVIEKYIKDLQKSHGTIKPKEDDGVVEAGNVCLVEYSFDLDENGASTRSALFEVSAEDELFGAVYKEFIGLKKEEEKVVNTKIPEKHFDKENIGKKANLRMKIININTRNLPALDDEFAKDLGFETIEQIKLDVQKKLDTTCEAKERDELLDEILDLIVADSTFDIPKSLIESETSRMVINFSYMLRQSGQNIDDYLKNEGLEADKFIEQQREKSIVAIKKSLALGEIMKTENIDITDEEINQYLTDYSSDNEVSLAKLKADYEKPEVKSNINNEVKTKKILDFLIENSKVGKGEKKKLDI